MPLQSELFRDDAALEACLVRDSAHVTKGARGQHVAKIQFALWLLDDARIDTDELNASVFGETTADAVLDYKVERDIVNRSYQQRADNIVGKMTVASLDREMVADEKRRNRRSCKEPSNGAAPLGRQQGVQGESVGDGPQRFGAIARVIFQLVGVRGTLGPQSLAIVVETLRRANELAKPVGIGVVANVGAGFDVPYPMRVKNESRFDRLRQGAEEAVSGFTSSLRVLLCPFEDKDENPDLKTNGVSTTAVDQDRKPFKQFVVINSLILRKDRATLLHEMIHCSDESLMGEFMHDPDGSGSIFSWDSDRTTFRPPHAEALRNAFFSLRR